MPMVKGAEYMAISPSQGVDSEKDITIILRPGKRLSVAAGMLGNGGRPDG